MPSALEREVYLQERRDLIQAEAEQVRSFDRAVLTLSAGALGLSITFIKDLVPNFTPGTGWLVNSAWGLLVLSLLSTLSSFQVSAWAIRRQREILDAELADVSASAVNKPAQCTAWLNWISLILFVVGAAFLTLFVALNFYGDGRGQ